MTCRLENENYLTADAGPKEADTLASGPLNCHPARAAGSIGMGLLARSIAWAGLALGGGLFLMQAVHHTSGEGPAKKSTVLEWLAWVGGTNSQSAKQQAQNDWYEDFRASLPELP